MESELRKAVQEVSKIRVDRSHGLAALKKPLLLLLVLSRFENGESKQNRISFREVEMPLDALIRRYGGKTALAGGKPEQPFFHMGSEPFWFLDIPKDAPRNAHGRPVLSVLRRDDCFARFDLKFYALLSRSAEFRAILAAQILNQWWPESQREELRAELGLPSSAWRPESKEEKRRRDPEFRRIVLENYRHHCALCGFSAIFAERHFGLEAAHIRAVQFDGPDAIDNGLAMCSIHHDAFDRGAIGVTESKRIIVSRRFSGMDDRALGFIEGLNGKALLDAKGTDPARRHIAWHRKNVFVD